MDLSQGSSSSSTGTASRQVRRPPPPRLGWPAAVAGNDNVLPEPEGVSSQKRPRRVTFGNDTQPVVSRKAQQLWTEKYAPKSSADLAVAPKKVKEIKEFMQNRQHKLLILVGSPGIGKSTAVRCLAKELDLELHEWTESYSSSFDDNACFGMLSIERSSPLASFQQFLEQTGTGFRSLQLEGTCKKRHPGAKTTSSLILLDELPNLHDATAEARFRDIMSSHIQQTVVPTILVYSDTVEGKHRPDALERLIEPSLLYSNLVQVLQIHKPTKAKFQKVVQAIVKAEGGCLLRNPEELHTDSGGDLRFAISTLQYEMVGGDETAKKQRTNSRPNRDTKLSSFHALGKLLYAKRKKDVPGTNGERAPLEFNPETVVEQSDMEISGVLHFLQYHCSDFFTDSIELSDAFELFSDAAMMVDSVYTSSALPAYASSLAGRAVANANLHPAAHRFRQFSSPKVFEVLRKRSENKSRIRKLCSDRRLNGQVSSASAGASAATFAVDVMPFMRTILPNHYVSSAFLESYFDPDSAASSWHARGLHRRNKQAEEEEAAAAQAMQQQQEVLQMDDIVEDDENW